MQPKQQFFLAAVLFLLAGAAIAVAVQSLQPKQTCANAAQLILSPPADQTYLEQIASAQKHIDLMLYQFSYNPLKKALGQAVQRGVTVRIILEPRVDSNLETAKELDALGVQVRWASREYANTHAKTMAIDGKKLVAGSTNWSQHAMKQNREVSVLIESEALTLAFLQVFEEDWKKAKEYVK